MKKIFNIYTVICSLVLGVFASSCVDDLSLGNFADYEEGECNVSFQMQGFPLQEAMTRTSGDAVKTVRNLYVLMYKADGENAGKLVHAFTTDTDCENDVFNKDFSMETSDADRSDMEDTAESSTPKLKTSSVLVSRGRYYIYAVANVDAFSSYDFTSEQISSPEKLKNYSLTWNNSNVAANDAMFGYFTGSSIEGFDVIGEEAPQILLSGDNQTIHAWMKRAVSKVTVAFDASSLRDGVNIYIKKVSVKDIPLNCKLGAENSPSKDSELIATGESIVYSNQPKVTPTTRISSKEPYFPAFSGYTDDETAVAEWREKVHSEKADALYFFENCQGTAPEGTDGYKQQTDVDGDNIPDDRTNNILKDTKPYGSYVEVEAYYTNDNFGYQTEGNIIYRFMLGMDTKYDFNARRNNHYKLTLKFKNNANDVDWHIDYSDQPGIYIPETIYVSYTYNTASKLPIRIVGQEVSDLSVSINYSNWFPEDSSIPYFTGTTSPTGLSTGFLSLTYDDNPRVGRSDEDFDASKDYAKVKAYWDNQPNNTSRQYIRNGQKVEWSDLNPHGYKVTTRTTSEGDKVFEADIPMFTRPLVIYKICAWTGSNPYYSSEREAEITLSGTVDNQKFERKIKVIQVRRVENPAGIYRRHDNASPFNVTLMEREGEGGLHRGGAVSYSPLVSKGAWRAIVYRSTTGSSSVNESKAWFNLTAGSQRVSDTGKYIQGDAGTPVAFTYTPNGTVAENVVRCGIIKVEYNDYTCTHYIFVRQGYAPMRLEEEAGKVYWHSFNLYSGNEETTNPCEAGSQFIRGYLAPAILDSNTAGWGEKVNSLQAFTNTAGTSVSNISIPLANSGSYVRKDFQSSNLTLTNNNSLNPYNKGRIPTIAEWAGLLNEVANAQVDRAYGVLYADGATTTQTMPVEVYGCLHSDVASGNNGFSSKGMRGTFVYNTSLGRNLFFPIGASGYGRRKVGSNGELQYSFGNDFWSTPLENATRAPLYNLYTNEGAIYWAQADLYVGNQPGFNNVTNVNAWDINYKSYDFDFMDSKSNSTPSAFLRLVQDSAP